MIRQQFDFHLHTSNSDGDYSVEKLVSLVRENGIQNFSISDHDNIKSVQDIKNVDITNLNYITGVEFSCIHLGKYEMHILGYGFDGENQQMKQACLWVKNQRIKRMKDIIATVETRTGLAFSEEEINGVISNNNPGRPHLAKLILKHQLASDSTDAFVKYLGGLKSEHNYRLTTKEAFDIIHNAGGKVIWAHPIKVEKKYHLDITEIIDSLIAIGLDGIEIGNILHSYDDVLRYQSLAKQKGLLVSAGSDYHGPVVKPDVDMGVVYYGEESEIINLEELTFLQNISK